MNGARKVVFRADASPSIGYGHYIRSLALADMLKDDFDCLIVTQDPTRNQCDLASPVCPLKQVPADDSKFDIFLKMLHGDEIVVLDNYFYSTEYQKEIKAKGCRLVCIDDMHDKHYVSDVLINHALTDRSLYSVEPYTKLCLGLDWALLRKPFLNQPVHKPIAVPCHVSVLVAFGGADPLHLTYKAVAALSKSPRVVKITAVTGFENTAPCDSPRNVDYLHNLSAEKMAALYRDCDLAILPTSTVCMEAMASGLPVISGYYADNQKEGYLEYTERGFVRGIGELPSNLTAENIEPAMIDCILSGGNRICAGRFAAIPGNYRSIFKEL